MNATKKLKKFLSKNKPLFGNNRSFSNRATRRKFSTNRQKFLINGKKYAVSTNNFNSI